MKPDLLLQMRQTTPDGLLWDDRRKLLCWTDIPERKLLIWDGAADDPAVHPMPGRVGSLAVREGVGLVVAMEHAFATWSQDDGVSVICEPEQAFIENRFNDGRCDRQGRFLAGSLNIDRSGRTGRLWSLDATGAVREVAGGVGAANGLAFSPDGRTMYWADTRADTVFAFDYDEDTGEACNQRVWLPPGAAPGFPDGAAVDTTGCYWSARWGGGCVVRVTPDGRVDRTIPLPASRVAMCAFGGSDLRTLFITTATERATEAELEAEPLAGSVFAIGLDVAGMAEPRFAG